MERSHTVKIKKTKSYRIRQGDIIKNVDCLEYAIEKSGQVEIGLIHYPYVVVLTQDCDLQQDADLRKRVKEQEAGNRPIYQGNLLFAILVAPLYNVEHVYAGDHLSELGVPLPVISPNATPGKSLRNKENQRYHFLEFPKSIQVVPSVIDFKHYFTVNPVALMKSRRSNYICNVDDLFREDISQRFASYLSRIGLPLLDLDGKVVSTAKQKQESSNDKPSNRTQASNAVFDVTSAN